MSREIIMQKTLMNIKMIIIINFRVSFLLVSQREFLIGKIMKTIKKTTTSTGLRNNNPKD